MLSFPAYEILSTLYESERHLIFRARRNVDNSAVIIKLFKKEYPDEMDVARIKWEHETISRLKSPFIVRAYALESYANMMYIVLGDLGGFSLSEWLTKDTLPLADFFHLAIHITEGLMAIHENGIVHGDINPANIVWNRDTDETIIIDFDSSCPAFIKSPPWRNQLLSAGSLAYISPEQTGRINRAIDKRSDFYSLGVTFYQSLTGSLPFATEDPMELVYSHIAITPPPVDELNSSIPKALSDIVAKLMNKDPDERYNSATGIGRDLELCLDEFTKSGVITQFRPGLEDYRGEFRIPQKLYERTKELSLLFSTFQRISSGYAEMMLISGSAGVGKTALVKALQIPVTEKKGFFIEGKFDQYQRNIPYFACRKAYTSLIDQLLTANADNLAAWKDKLQKALGNNGKLLTDIIPNLQLVIGSQPDVPQLPPGEAQNRFNHVFRQFIGAIAGQEHPLVVFIDDLQWVDASSLDLWNSLLTGDGLRYFLFIGAYRTNEIAQTHPLVALLENMRQGNFPVSDLEVQNMTLDAVNELVADTLHENKLDTLPLASLLYSKTRGNAFFVIQFLRSLCEKGWLKFDGKRWQWDITKISQLNITDNVVTLMTERLGNLPADTLEILKLAACIGNSFTWEMLAVAAQKTEEELDVLLRQPLSEGMIELLPTGARFAHDRIQQAMYLMLDQQERLRVHLRIGRLWNRYCPAEKREERIFETVNQWNLAIDIINDPNERIRLAELNLLAGRRAKGAAAHREAFNYLATGSSLVPTEDWPNLYGLFLSLRREAAEAAYLCGDFVSAGRLAEEVLLNATTVLDKIGAYKVQSQICWAQKRQIDGIRILLPVLAEMGIHFPENPTPSDVQAGLRETWAKLAGRRIEDLVDLPLMTDPEKLAAMEILATIRPLAYMVFPSLYPLINLAMVNLSVEYGNAPLSAYGYTGYALLLEGTAGDIDASYRFATLALNVLDRLKAREVASKASFSAYAFVMHYKDHLKEMLQPLLDASAIGMENGDMAYAALSAYAHCTYSFFSGTRLSELEREMTEYSDSIRRIKQEVTLGYNEIYRQLVLNLTGRSLDPTKLKGEACDEQTVLPALKKAGDYMGLNNFHLARSIAGYLFGDYRQAAKDISAARRSLIGVQGLVFVPVCNFYESLISLALYPEAKDLRKKAILERVALNQEKMRHWAHHAPMNHLHKYYLVEAEKNRALGRENRASRLYDQACALAQEHGYLNEEALAFELAARSYLAAEKTEIARYHMREAHYCYERWGASAKVHHLEECFPHLLSRPSAPVRHTVSPGYEEAASQTLDLTTVIKAAETIAREIDLAALLKKMMKIVLENAGAERGCFIRERDGALFIEAQGRIGDGQVHVLGSVPVTAGGVSTAIVNFVARTGETVVLDDAGEGSFAQTAYIRSNQPKSVLCIPLANQGKSTGLLYLENNAVRGAFVHDRVKVLEFLTAQIAISIENATLYKQLETSEARYRAIFENSGAALMFIEHDTTISLVNKKFEKLLGYSKSQIEGRMSWRQLAGTSEDLIRMNDFHHRRRVDPAAAPLTYESTMIDAQGNLKYIQVAVALLPGGRQSMAAILDITQRKEAEEALLRAHDELELEVETRTHELTAANEELQAINEELSVALDELKKTQAYLVASEKMAALGDLVAGMAHEINTPVGVAVTAASHLEIITRNLVRLYEKDALKRSDFVEYIEDTGEAVRIILTNLDRSAGLIRSFKRISVDQSSEARRVFNLKSYLEEVLLSLSPRLKTTRHTVTIRCAADIQMDTFPGACSQVITNLVMNSLMHGYGPDDAGAIVIAADRVSEGVVLTYTDDGKGMDSAVLGRIFEPFFTTRRGDGATGLGLHILYNIVTQQFGGTVECHSQPGRGVTFIIRCPFGKEAPDHEPK